MPGMPAVLAALLQTTTAVPPDRTQPAALTWGQTLMASLAGAFAILLSAVPRIIGFIIILLIGWLVASLLARGVLTLLRAIRFDELLARAGVGDMISRMGAGLGASGIVAATVKWLVRIVVLLVASDVLGLPAVSDVLRQFLLWLPNLVVALVVLVVAGLAARALGNIVRGATEDAGFTNP